MRVISIANFKGGTGKTVTACNLAALLARDGLRVLLIDADAQHNASDFFCEDWDGPTLTNILEGTGETVWSDNVAPSSYENLDLICADMGLLRPDLASILNGHNAAQRRMDDLIGLIGADGEYDWILIDCPPSFTAASVAALTNSDEVLLPTRVDSFSRRGALELISQVRSTGRAMAGTRFRVLPTMTDGRSNLSKQAVDLLRMEKDLEITSTVIRAGIAVGESSYARQPLYQYAPNTNVARDYENLATEIRNWEQSVLNRQIELYLAGEISPERAAVTLDISRTTFLRRVDAYKSARAEAAKKRPRGRPRKNPIPADTMKREVG